MAQVPPFSELIAATTRSAVHLELRDTYDPDTLQYREWLAGTPRPVPASPEWYDFVREHTARGVRFRRARIVSEPLSDYIRFEHEATAGLNVAAGEEVRWLPRRLARGLSVPVNDYWVFDDRLVRFGYFAGNGRYLGDELTDDQAIVRSCMEAFECAWELAVPHADYRPAYMGVSPSSSVQRARQELADRLREIRLDAGLTARALSAEAGWHEAKTSRIESAKQVPSEDDIRTWCEVCHAPKQAVDLIAASRAADSAYIEWRRLNRTGMRYLQENKRPLYERTALFKVYCSTLVPGLVQTPGYATALLSSISAFRETPNDVEDAVAARMSRNHILRSPGKRFVLLVEEAVLRYGIGAAETMLAQLGHLMTVTTQPNVRLGIIPIATLERPMWTVESFNIFDDATVHVELLSAQVTVTVPGEVVVYLRAFDQLAGLAVYGSEARSLIAEAISGLNHLNSSQVPASLFTD